MLGLNLMYNKPDFIKDATSILVHPYGSAVKEINPYIPLMWSASSSWLILSYLFRAVFNTGEPDETAIQLCFPVQLSMSLDMSTFVHDKRL